LMQLHADWVDDLTNGRSKTMGKEATRKREKLPEKL